MPGVLLQESDADAVGAEVAVPGGVGALLLRENRRTAARADV
ncbi:hypothetical protein ACFXAW_02655 [Streptomyces sp. NPDC059445]